MLLYLNSYFYLNFEKYTEHVFSEEVLNQYRMQFISIFLLVWSDMEDIYSLSSNLMSHELCIMGFRLGMVDIIVHEVNFISTFLDYYYKLGKVLFLFEQQQEIKIK